MAVVIIDVQNDFCSDKGITSNSGRNVKNIQAAVNNISRLLDNLRKLNTKIIFFKLIYDLKDCVGTYEANDVALKYMREQCAANIIDSKNFIKSIRNFKKTDE